MTKRSINRPAALLLALWLTAAAALSPALAAPADRITISSAEDLRRFGENCALDTWSRGRTVTLTADLDLSGLAFTPIPTFGGTFLGQGHTISGLCLAGPGSSQGLFRYIQPAGVVQDLTVRGAVLPGGSRSTVGGLAGVNEGTIQNCAFQGTVSGDSTVGGIAGRNAPGGQIIGCSAAGTVSGSSSTGGIAGRNAGMLLKCTNSAGVNLTETDSDISLTDLEAPEVLTERASSGEDEAGNLFGGCSDTGGVAGYSSGIIQSCVNNGDVGYPHVGYNTGGIAGRQSGYLAGCVNNGTVHGRKDVGGIVGQAEPYLVIDPGRDTIDRLRGELDTLDRLINRALDDAQAAGDSVSAHLTAMGDYTGSARDSSKRLVDRITDFTDENIDTVNTLTADLTNALDRISPALDDLSGVGDRLERLSGQLGDALDSLDGAVDIGDLAMAQLRTAAGQLRQSARDLRAAAEGLNRALDALLQGVVSGDQGAETAALARLRSGSAQLSRVFSDTSGAVSDLRDALAGIDIPAISDTLPALSGLEEALAAITAALERISALLPSQDDLQQAQEELRLAFNALRSAGGSLDSALSSLQQALGSAGGLSGQLGSALRELQDVSGSAAAIGKLLSSAFRTVSDAVDTLTKGGPAEFSPLGEEVREASDSLFDALSGVSAEMEGINNALQSGSSDLTADLRAVSRQFNVVFNVMMDAIDDLGDNRDEGLDSVIQDTSDVDITATREGKVADCTNAGIVEGDRNVGGVVGAMAIEFDLDPEDDDAGRLSFGSTYETKAVLHNCLNRGSITAKKDCAGGLAGRMDLGTALACQNYGAVASTGGDYVGGVAGWADASVRSCYAKSALSGGNYIGGIAGWASSLRDSCAIATIEAGNECLGAVAGNVETGGVLSGNRFVDTGTAGVDGVSYAGRAEPIAFDQLSLLPDIPPEFTAFTLTLKADGEVVARLPFYYGDDLSRLQLPQVPDREDSYGVWPEFDTSGVNSDITLEAVYAPWITLAASAEQIGKLSIALAEGRFTDQARLSVTTGAAALPPEAGTDAEVWEVSLTGSGLGPEDTVPLRLLNPAGGEATVWQYENGQWRQVEAVRNGQYLLLSMAGTRGIFCVQPRAGSLWPLLPAAAALLLAVFLLLRIRKKKAAARDAKAQKEAEEHAAT